MERNEIIRKHPQINPCDFGVPEIYREMAENYATWCASAEREECAKLCDDKGKRVNSTWIPAECATAIRARIQK